MKYGCLPGGPPPRPKSSPVRVVAGHVLSQLRRPGRIRSRMLLLFIAIFGIIFVSYGRQHSTELDYTASSLTSYIPTSITNAIATYGEDEDTRWDVNPKNDSKHIVIKKPKFHLLIPTHKHSANLCRTLFSAAALNYPPPTLISYGGSPNSGRPGMDSVKNTFSFLLGKEVHHDDLLLIVAEDTWVQLPAEVTISRFFKELKASSIKLLDKYGRIGNSNGTEIPKFQRAQKYSQTVLFSSAKACSNEPSDPACYSVPQSPLPKDIYGPKTDQQSEAKYNRPRHMESSMLIGRAADLRPIYKRASEMLEFEDIGKKGSQYVFSQIFGEQEYARALDLSSARASTPAWQSWFSSPVSKPDDRSIAQPNITLNSDQNYEFGIGLDYLSSVFQVLKNSVEDVQIVRFDDQSTILAPSRIKAASYKIKHALRLPQDLLKATPPYTAPSNMSSTDSVLKSMPVQEASWSSVPLLTNTIIPSSSIPATLNIHNTDGIGDDMWLNMWYHNFSRALLHEQMNRPVEPIATDGGERWFDVRAGKGGIWTERGEWVIWDAVCGGFEEGVFGDRLGASGEQKGVDGGKVEEDQGLVHGLWGKIVGTGEEKEKSMGIGDVAGGFSQGKSAVDEQAENDESGKGKSGSAHSNKFGDEDGKHQDDDKHEVKDKGAGKDKQEKKYGNEKTNGSEKTDDEVKEDKNKGGGHDENKDGKEQAVQKIEFEKDEGKKNYDVQSKPEQDNEKGSSGKTEKEEKTKHKTEEKVEEKNDDKDK